MKSLMQRLFYRITTLYLRLMRKNEVMSFPTAFRAAQTVAIFLPPREKDIMVACRTLGRFQKILAPRKILLICEESLTNHIPELWGNEVITYSDKSITPWFTPNRSLKAKLKNIGVDIFINLNPVFDLFLANLSIYLKAKLRISLYNDQGEYFFNFQINDSGHQFLDQKYTSILKYVNLMISDSLLKNALSPSS